MKQIIQSYRSGELWLGDVPTPALRAGGAVVRTAASLVSAGTERMVIELAKKSLLGKARARPDLVRKVIAKIKTEGLSQTMQKVFGKLDTPIPLGYSCAGTIVEVGPSAADLKVGDRVACAGAGYATHAEYNFVPKNLLAKIPEPITFEDASFTTLGAIAMQGVRQADVRLGERVVVIGLGLLGLLTVQLLKASGCLVLGSDPNGARCRLAIELGADDAVALDAIDAAAAFTSGRGADSVIITAATPSNAPLETAAEVARVHGRVVVVGVVGMNVPRDPFYKKELDLRLSMSYGPGRYDPNFEEAGHDYPFGYVRWTEQRNMQSFLELVAAGKVTPGKLVTHRYDIDEALRAYELLESGSTPYLGILITYPQTASLGARDRVVSLRPCKPSEKIGIGLIGAGNFAKGVLLPAIKRCGADIELVGLCTSTGMSAAETGKKHGFAYATTDHLQLLADDRINAVFIATRHDTHAQLASAALAAGKHVFVEKPLCVKPDELELYEAALCGGGSGSLLMIGFNRRFSPHAMRVRDTFAKRTTPALVTYRINAGSIPDESWVQNNEIGGGRIIGEVCHFVDLCEFLIGSPATSVRADCVASNNIGIKPQDSTVMTVCYHDGSVASIQFVSLGPADLPKERIEMFADGAAAVIDDFSRTTFYGTRRRAFRSKQDKGIAAEISAFFGAIQTGGAAPIPIDAMFRTTRLTFHIHESLRSGNSINLVHRSHRKPLHVSPPHPQNCQIPPSASAHRANSGSVAQDLRRIRVARRERAPVYPGCRWKLKAPMLPPGAQRNRGDDLARGVFTFLNRAENLGWPPQWNPAHLPKLWQYNLHYFEYLWALDFARAKVLVQDWIEHHPCSRGAVGWEPYPLSLRLENWCGFFFDRHRNETEQDPQFLQLLWESCFHQTLWLTKRLEFHLLGNHLLENAASLLLVGSCFAGSHVDRWRATGLALLRRELGEQMLPDGGHFERSPMYHARATYLLSMLFNVGDDEVQALVREPLIKALEAAECMTLADGQLALLNDSAWGITNSVGELRAHLARMDVTIPPRDSGSFALRDSGYFGWFSNGSGVICDAGLIGPDYLPGHAHGDVFSCELYLHNYRLIVDSGVFDYEPGEMRRYCRSTAAHNTIEIDGQDQCEFWGVFRVARRGRPRDILWEPFENGFRLSGWHDGYARLGGKPVHHRLLRWHQPGILMVRDTVKSKSIHEIVSRLHLHPDCTIEQSDARSFKISYPGGLFKIFTAGADSVAIEKSWFCPEFGVKLANQAIALRTTGSAAELGICILDGTEDGALDLRKGMVSDGASYGW